VVHIATRYLRGGSERRIRDIVQSFPEADHHVVLGRESDPELARSHLRPSTLTIVPALVREPDIVKDVIALGKLAALLRRSSFDLVVTHQSKAGVLGRTAARMSRRTPVIHSLSMTSFGPGYPAWQDLASRMLEARLARLTTAYAVAGRDLASRYHSIGVPRSKLNVVRSGVRLPSIKSVTESARRRLCDGLGIPGDRPIVLYLGSLEPRKNVLSLPSFLAQLLAFESADRPFLVVAGEGPQSGELEWRLEAMGLSRDAALVGFVTDPGPLVVMANAIVLLSSAEGISQVLVQAAAAGTPFVAYAVDGAQELLDEGAVGAVVPLGDVRAAAMAAAEVLRGRRGRAPSIDLAGWDEVEIASEYRRLLASAMSARANGDASKNGDRRERSIRLLAGTRATTVGQPDSGTRA
jgi:glycosyltransferase involved in cell wall biosynthesis